MTREKSAEIAEDLFDHLVENDLNLPDGLEVLANVFIMLGSSYIPEVLESPDKLRDSQLLDLVIKERKEKGETMANATVLQGFNILTWLHR